MSDFSIGNLGNIDLSSASHRIANSLAPVTGRPVGGPVSRVASAVVAGAKDTTSTTATGSADITSNDFLTLLVSELKNQDPTQPTDPNAYVQQLVGVNSLQQLISINQDLSGSASGGKAQVSDPVAVV